MIWHNQESIIHRWNNTYSKKLFIAIHTYLLLALFFPNTTLCIKLSIIASFPRNFSESLLKKIITLGWQTPGWILPFLIPVAKDFHPLHLSIIFKWFCNASTKYIHLHTMEVFFCQYLSPPPTCSFACSLPSSAGIIRIGYHWYNMCGKVWTVTSF